MQQYVVIFSNMKTGQLFKRRVILGKHCFAELVVWRLPNSVKGSVHAFKYRLALFDHGKCVLRYDNEAGKGDHKHVDSKEELYRFENIDQLLSDFFKDVERWKDEHSNP